MNDFRPGQKSAPAVVRQNPKLFWHERALVGVNADKAADIDRQGRRT